MNEKNPTIWEPILRDHGINDPIIPIAARYCDRHAQNELGISGFLGHPSPTLLLLAIKILKNLELKNKQLILTRDTENYNILIDDEIFEGEGLNDFIEKCRNNIAQKSILKDQ